MSKLKIIGTKLTATKMQEPKYMTEIQKKKNDNDPIMQEPKWYFCHFFIECEFR